MDGWESHGFVSHFTSRLIVCAIATRRTHDDAPFNVSAHFNLPTSRLVCPTNVVSKERCNEAMGVAWAGELADDRS